jgi:hypothetical protein
MSEEQLLEVAIELLGDMAITLNREYTLCLA